MEFHFESREKKTYTMVKTLDKNFYQLETSCSLIFLHTDGKILLDIEDKTIKNILETLVSKENLTSKPVIGDSFAVDITGEKIGIDKLVFFYTEGRIDNKELAIFYKNDDEKSAFRELVKQKFFDQKLEKQELDAYAALLYGHIFFPFEKINRDFIDVLNNNTNGSLSIQYPMTLSHGFCTPKGIYNEIMEKLLLESQWHNITSVDLCCGDEWRRYADGSVRGRLVIQCCRTGTSCQRQWILR